MPCGSLSKVSQDVRRVCIAISDDLECINMIGKEVGNLAVGSCHATAIITMLNKIPTIYLRMLLQQLPDKVVRVKLCVEVADNL